MNYLTTVVLDSFCFQLPFSRHSSWQIDRPNLKHSNIKPFRKSNRSVMPVWVREIPKRNFLLVIIKIFMLRPEQTCLSQARRTHFHESQSLRLMVWQHVQMTGWEIPHIRLASPINWPRVTNLHKKANRPISPRPVKALCSRTIQPVHSTIWQLPVSLNASLFQLCAHAHIWSCGILLISTLSV